MVADWGGKLVRVVTNVGTGLRDRDSVGVGDTDWRWRSWEGLQGCLFGWCKAVSVRYVGLAWWKNVLCLRVSRVRIICWESSLSWLQIICLWSWVQSSYSSFTLRGGLWGLCVVSAFDVVGCTQSWSQFQVEVAAPWCDHCSFLYHILCHENQCSHRAEDVLMDVLLKDEEWGRCAADLQPLYPCSG